MEASKCKNDDDNWVVPPEKRVPLPWRTPEEDEEFWETYHEFAEKANVLSKLDNRPHNVGLDVEGNFCVAFENEDLKRPEPMKEETVIEEIPKPIAEDEEAEAAGASRSRAAERDDEWLDERKEAEEEKKEPRHLGLGIYETDDILYHRVVNIRFPGIAYPEDFWVVENLHIEHSEQAVPSHKGACNSIVTPIPWHSAVAGSSRDGAAGPDVVKNPQWGRGKGKRSSSNDEDDEQ